MNVKNKKYLVAVSTVLFWLLAYYKKGYIYSAVKKFAGAGGWYIDNAPPLALDFRFCQRITRLQNFNASYIVADNAKNILALMPDRVKRTCRGREF